MTEAKKPNIRGNRWSCRVTWPDRTTYWYFRSRWGAERFARRARKDETVVSLQVTGIGSGALRV